MIDCELLTQKKVIKIIWQIHKNLFYLDKIIIIIKKNVTLKFVNVIARSLKGEKKVNQFYKEVYRLREVSLNYKVLQYPDKM